METLLDVARRENADLLVVGNRGLAGIKGRLLGSVPADATRRSGPTSPSCTPPTRGRQGIKEWTIRGDPCPRRSARHRATLLDGRALHLPAGGRDVRHAAGTTQWLWRALGFADTDNDDPAFTDADIAALQVFQC